MKVPMAVEVPTAAAGGMPPTVDRIPISQQGNYTRKSWA